MKLSILTHTYNHARFIEEAITGVLSQRTEFDFEYLISDDCSTDNTSEVVNRIIKEHPRGHLISFYRHEKNQGSVKNFYGGLKKCRGEFVGFCDSDDFWQDPSKLQKQVDYLDDNKSCVLTYHGFVNRAVEEISDGHLGQFADPLNKVLFRPQTSTLVIRNVLDDVPEELVDSMPRMNDQLLRFLLSHHGYFHCLNDIDPNIRSVHNSNIFGTKGELQKLQSSLHCWQLIYSFYKDTEYEPYLKKRVSSFDGQIKWLEFRMAKSTSQKSKQFIEALIFDVQSGRLARNIVRRLRKFIAYPYQLVKKVSTENHRIHGNS